MRVAFKIFLAFCFKVSGSIYVRDHRRVGGGGRSCIQIRYRLFEVRRWLFYSVSMRAAVGQRWFYERKKIFKKKKKCEKRKIPIQIEFEIDTKQINRKKEEKNNAKYIWKKRDEKVKDGLATAINIRIILHSTRKYFQIPSTLSLFVSLSIALYIHSFWIGTSINPSLETWNSPLDPCSVPAEFLFGIYVEHDLLLLLFR